MAKAKNNLQARHNWIKNCIAVVTSVFFFAPFYIIISLSFKVRGDRSSHWLFPSSPKIESYFVALTKGNIGTAIVNTLIVTVFAVVLIVLFGSIASYPLARHRSKLNKFILSAFVGVMMVPPLSVLVPIYRLMVSLGGINTFWGIIILSTTYGLPMSVFMFSNFISTIPKELDEAALLDGCSQFAIFPRIILPNMMPVVSSVIILTGVSIWNDYSFQLYILQKPKLRTITLAMSSFFSEGMTNLPAAAAAAVLAVLPVVLLYLFLQKYFIKGTVDSAVK
ncbi:MAG: carbohydrate ABC transporter permease [Sphaerochaetaceae bacterium]|nr:carbohydrate ABC transporter permease [uncultured Sphaerochaeta sp.]MDC7229631.1 carbohydrate ABC transporter permease [Sphaerochaetaceae bacterium]